MGTLSLLFGIAVVPLLAMGLHLLFSKESKSSSRLPNNRLEAKKEDLKNGRFKYKGGPIKRSP